MCACIVRITHDSMNSAKFESFRKLFWNALRSITVRKQQRTSHEKAVCSYGGHQNWMSKKLRPIEIFHRIVHEFIDIQKRVINV